MILGTKDNIIELIKLIEEQKLNYVIALWTAEKPSSPIDEVTIYTSFEKNAIKKLSDALKDSVIIPDNIKKNENKH